MEGKYKHFEDTLPRTSLDNSSSEDTLLEAEKEIAISRPQRHSFWRRHCLAACVHVSIFIIYTSLAQVLIALNPLWQHLLAHETTVQQPYLPCRSWPRFSEVSTDDDH